MSTKTSIKRIAAVAAVALTLGGFSAVSAHAESAPIADTLAASATTVTATSGVLSQVVLTQGFIASANTDTAYINAVLLSSPALNIATPIFETASVTGYTDAGSPVRPNANSSSIKTTTAAQSATYTKVSYNLDFTPVVAGTYTVKVYPTLGGTAAANAGTATAITITYTVAAKPVISAAATTVYSSSDFTKPATTSTADEGATIVKSKVVADLNPVAVLNVTEANGSTAYPMLAADALAISATVAGPGLVSFDQNRANAGRAVTNATAFNSSGGGTYAALNQKLYVYADGTPGTSTITLSTTDANGVTTVLGSQVVTFFGAAASYKATVVNSVITTSAYVAPDATHYANSGYHAVKVLVSDAAGNPVSGADVYAISDNTAVLNLSYTKATSGASGYAYFNLQGASVGTANVSFTSKTSATDASTTVITAPAVAIRVGSATASAVAVSFDASSYQPGAAGVVTVSVTDSKGLPVANGVYTVFSGAATASLAFVQGSTPGTAGVIGCTDASLGTTTTAASASACAGGSYISTPVVAAGQVLVTGSTGTATFKVNMPLAAGALTLSATGDSGLAAAQAGLAVTASTTVGGGAAADAAQAAVDAANEATDAANAATDAANNAMDSADAAQQAALDAGDKADAALAAVTDLATKVSAIATQIAALSALVKKIAAKVKA
jgi:hypothetical protein